MICVTFLEKSRGFLLVVATLVGVFSVAIAAEAANEENVAVIGGAYSLSGAWGGVLNVGGSAEVRSASVNHVMGTVEGSLTILPSDSLTFSFDPENPEAVLDKGIFSRDSLFGQFSNSLNDRNDCNASPSVFSIGMDQYSFVLCGTKPSFSLSSSNTAAVTCSGSVCTAGGTGSSRITATIAGTPIKMWGNKSGESIWSELVSSVLSSAALSWDVTVVSPPTLTFTSSVANPIPYGTTTTLSWNAQNVISGSPCVASGDWSGAKSASGTFDTGNLTARRDYTLTCAGPSGDTVQKTFSVLVGSPTPSPQVNLSAGSTLIPYNTETTLSWSVSNPSFTTSCVAEGDWSGSRPFTGSQATGKLTTDSVYILECFGSGGSQAKQVTVRVIPPPSPPNFRTYSVDPDHILYNSSTNITWDVQSAASCTASSDAAVPFANWNGSVPLSGSRAVSGLTATTIFSLSCTGAGGTKRQDVTVRVEPQSLQPPTISFFSADKNALVYNEATTIRWKVTQADWCEASGDWDWWSDIDFEDSYDTGNLSASRDYVLHCENLAGWVEQTVHISVSDPVQPVTLTFTATPSTVDSGGNVRAQWDAQNAQWCYLEWWRAGVYQEKINNISFSGDEQWKNLTASEDDLITCGNSINTVSAWVHITVNPPPGGSPPPPGSDPPLPDPPIISFTRDSAYVSYNTATMLRWNVVGADMCSAWNDQYLPTWEGSHALSGTASTGNLRAETVFSLECVGPGGAETASVRVRVADPSQVGPTLSFWADRIDLSSGESTRLRWVSTDATACVASGDWSGSKALQSPVAGFDTGVLSTSRSYQLRCSSPGGAVVVTVNISVDTPPPTPSLSLYVDDAAVPLNGSTILRWSAQNVESCVASGDWGGNVPLAGGRSTGILSEERPYEYVIECTNGLPNGIVSAKAGVAVGGSVGFGPSINFAPDASVVPFGSSPTLRLTASYSDQCCLSVNDNWATCPPLGNSGVFVPTSAVIDKNFPPGFIQSITSPTTYYAVCTYTDSSGSMIWSKSSAPVGIGRVLLCPASTDRNIILGNTLQFDAWYTENALADCSTVAGLGGTSVTDSASFETSWGVVSGGVTAVSGSPGLFRGTSPGPATVRVTHRPNAALNFFSEEADLVVGRPVTCYRCDASSFLCSSETQFDFVNDPAQCSSDTFGSSSACHFSCFKDRWEEVAP